MQLESARGTLFPKVARAKMIGRDNDLAALAYAQGRGPGWADAVDALKSGVTAMSTGTAEVLITPVGRDLSGFVRERTLIGRLALRRTPFNIPMIGTTQGATGSWTGEGRAIPVSALSFAAEDALPMTKIGCIVVVTNELVRSSAPSVETVLAREIGNAVSSALDLAFIGLDNAGVEGVKPASITNGATAFVSSGSAVADVDADLKKAIAVLTDSGISLDYASWVMPSRTATYLATLRDSNGSLAFPLVTARGGSLAGLPVVTSNAAMDVSSPTEATIVLVAADQIDLADDSGASLSYSDSASLQLSDSPADASTTEALTSLWQNNLAGVRATRVVNWRVRHAAAVSVISNVQF